MAWTQADLDAITAAIARGTRVVAHGDRSLTYHSLADMLQVRRIIQDELAAAAAGRNNFRYSVADFSDSTTGTSFDISYR